MYTGYTGPSSTTTVNESQGSTLEDIRYDTSYLSGNVYGEYVPRLGEDHSLKILAGWNLETKSYRTQTVKREGLTVPEKPSFSLMDGWNQRSSLTAYIGDRQEKCCVRLRILHDFYDFSSGAVNTVQLA